MTHRTTRPTLRNLTLTLALAAILTLAAVPCPAAPAHPDRAPTAAAPWSLDVQSLWSAFTGWIMNLWELDRALIDPNGEALPTSDIEIGYTFQTLTCTSTVTGTTEDRCLIDPNGLA